MIMIDYLGLECIDFFYSKTKTKIKQQNWNSLSTDYRRQFKKIVVTFDS